MYNTVLSYYINPSTKKFCDTTSPYAEILVPPVFYLGDRPTLNLSFPASTIASGESIITVLDNDFKIFNTKNATGLDPVMCGNIHTVTSAEASSQSVSITLYNYTQKFADVINGHNSPVNTILSVFQKTEDSSGNSTFVLLGMIYAKAQNSTITPDANFAELPVSDYYTKTEIDAIYEQFMAGVTLVLSYSNTAKSYAVGGTGTRTGEDTDNASYYAGRAQYYHGIVSELHTEVSEMKASVSSMKTQVSNDKSEVSSAKTTVESMAQDVAEDADTVSSALQTVVSNAEQVRQDKNSVSVLKSQTEQFKTEAQQASAEASSSASSASTSATSASNSATSASGSASDASASAASAGNSASAAEDSADEASASATYASTFASSASSSASSASSSASSASASATAAESAKDTAVTKASEASASAASAVQAASKIPTPTVSDVGKVPTVTSSGNYELAKPSGGTVNDVMVDGSSVVSGGTADISTSALVHKYSGSGAPTTSTVGAVGDLYTDTATGYVYECVGADETAEPAEYTWRKIGDENMPKSGGTLTGSLSSTSDFRNTVINLKSAVFCWSGFTNQTNSGLSGDYWNYGVVIGSDNHFEGNAGGIVSGVGFNGVSHHKNNPFLGVGTYPVMADVNNADVAFIVGNGTNASSRVTSFCILKSGGLRQGIQVIPANAGSSESPVQLSDGVWQHTPDSAPTYTLPAVTDTTVTHEIVLYIDCTTTASMAFQDSAGSTISPKCASTPAVGEKWSFLCRYEFGNWKIYGIKEEDAA